MKKLLLPAMIVILLGLGAGAVFTWQLLYPKIVQPIQFNHSLHVKEQGLECDTCHSLFKTHASSGFPSIEICAGCHEEPMTESPDEAKLLAHVRENREVAWNRIYIAKDNVYYSHRRHVVLGKLSCVECHGPIGETTSPPKRPLKSISMGTCIGCHEERNAKVDCLACHR